jgi:hypothetical protein
VEVLPSIGAGLVRYSGLVSVITDKGAGIKEGRIDALSSTRGAQGEEASEASEWRPVVRAQPTTSRAHRRCEAVKDPSESSPRRTSSPQRRASPLEHRALRAAQGDEAFEASCEAVKDPSESSPRRTSSPQRRASPLEHRALRAAQGDEAFEASCEAVKDPSESSPRRT